MKSPLIPIFLAVCLGAFGALVLNAQEPASSPAQTFATQTVQVEGLAAQIEALENQLAVAQVSIAEARTALEAKLTESGAPVQVYGLADAPAVVVVFKGETGLQVRMVQLIAGGGAGGSQ